VQEFPLGGGDGDFKHIVSLAVFLDFTENFVIGKQERIVVDVGSGPDLLNLWG
jgi:hypothetical protein